MNSTRLTRGGRSSKANDDAHLAAALAATDPQSILAAVGALLEARGMRAPWALPELTPLSSFVESHLRRKAKKASPATLSSLTSILIKFRGHCRGLNVQEVTGEHVQRWVESLEASHYAPGTVRKMYAAVYGMFARAKSLGYVRHNPCEDIDLPDGDSVVQRQPMLEADVERLLAYFRAERLDEWVTLTLLGRYAGIRLEDAFRMDGAAIRREGPLTVLSFTPRKTGNPVEMPVFEPLASHLRDLASAGPLCPVLAKLSVSCVSRHFTTHMTKAGLSGQPLTLPNGRVVSQVTYHSLRHSFVSDLSRRNIPENLRMRLSAHRTTAAHRRYDHLAAADLHSQLEGYFA